MYKYRIVNVGCDDQTVGEFDLAQEQFGFLQNIFDELNTHSDYVCMPKIYIQKLKD